MFIFVTRLFTEEDAQIVSGWQYAAPYDVYERRKPLPIAYCRALCDEENMLCGFFCWGKAARVATVKTQYEMRPDALDICIGLRPDLVGKGLGFCAMESALYWLEEAFAPSLFRLAVHAWNMRARYVYKKAGFEVAEAFGECIVMLRDNRPFRDASTPLEIGMHLYPDDPPFDRHLVWKKEECGFDVSLLTMSAHTGTHIDTPLHVGLPGGAEVMNLSILHGTVQLLDFSFQCIEDIRSSRILIKNTAAGLTQAEAQILVSTKLKFIGTDRLSVGIREEELLVHKTLLESGMVVLENAKLQDFSAGFYQMHCLPLSIPGCDGIPARLLLREEHS